MKVRRVGFKMLGGSVWDGLELRTETHDIYLRRDREVGWSVDVFDASVKEYAEPDAAHIESQGFEKLAWALAYIGGWGEE